jgi:hypothetical protein
MKPQQVFRYRGEIRAVRDDTLTGYDMTVAESAEQARAILEENWQYNADEFYVGKVTLVPG